MSLLKRKPVADRREKPEEGKLLKLENMADRILYKGSVKRVHAVIHIV
jgi:hypothetical protein